MSYKKIPFFLKNLHCFEVFFPGKNKNSAVLETDHPGCLSQRPTQILSPHNNAVTTEV